MKGKGIPSYTRKLNFGKNTWLLIIGIIFIAATLRSPLTSVGPIIAPIRDGLGISNVLAGFLTTIPLLAFALISPFAPKLSKRYGMELTLFISLCSANGRYFIEICGFHFLFSNGYFPDRCCNRFWKCTIASLNKVKLSITYWSHDGNLLGCYEYFSDDRLGN